MADLARENTPRLLKQELLPMEEMLRQWTQSGLLKRLRDVKKVFQEERNPKQFDKVFEKYSRFLDKYGG